jgi:hypothetical protein
LKGISPYCIYIHKGYASFLISLYAYIENMRFLAVVYT